MGDEIYLRFGGGVLRLEKSGSLVGLRPCASARRDFDVQIEEAIARRAVSRRRSLGGFEILEIDDDADGWLDRRRTDADVEIGSHVYHTSSDGVPFVPTGEIYVVFGESATPEAQSDVIRRHHLGILEARGDNAFILTTTMASRNPVIAAVALAEEGAVRIAEPDFATPAMTNDGSEPIEGLLSEQWHLHNTGRHCGTSVGFRVGADARVRNAWRLMRRIRRTPTRIAIIDDGYDLGHPDFGGGVVASRCFTRGSDDVSPDIGEWHGTSCAGVALARHNGGRTVGAAPDADLVAVRWGANLSDHELESWFDYVQQSGAAVCSCSWSAQARNYPLSSRAFDAIARCARDGRQGRGCVIAFAAGNDARDVNDPASESVNGFATHPDVIAVAATTSRDEQASYSNYGEEIWISAPSSGDGGWGIVTTDVRGYVELPDGRTVHAGYDVGAYTISPGGRFGGTSSACPLVAGVCALVLSANPQLTASEVRRLIAETARRLPDQEDLHDPRYGFGCVDAYEAVLAATQLPGASPLLYAEERGAASDLAI